MRGRNRDTGPVEVRKRFEGTDCLCLQGKSKPCKRPARNGANCTALCSETSVNVWQSTRFDAPGGGGTRRNMAVRTSTASKKEGVKRE